MNERSPVSPAGTSGDRADIGDVDSRWRDLFSGGYGAAVVVMAGGIGLYAINLYFTAALMPSVVADIGGQRFYAWAYTGYLISAVVATLFVGPALAFRGPAWAYVLAFGTFALATLSAAVAPSMGVLIAARVIQGFGAGMLTGLGFAVIRSVLPARLWTRATGLVSAMFGLGTLAGPSAGGAFAQYWSWRGGFTVLAVVAVVLLGLAVAALRGSAASGHGGGIPMLPVLVLAGSTATLSVASTLSGARTVVAIVVGAALLAGFLLADARHQVGVLPRRVYRRRDTLKWVYVTVAGLCAGVMVENYLPLFGQDLAGLPPLWAGLLGAVLSMGWVIAQLASTSVPEHLRPLAIRCAPVLLTAGLTCLSVTLTHAPSAGRIAVWVVLLLIAGVGIGIAFPHLNVAAMSSSADPAEGAKAAAALSTTQLIAFTMASALTGILFERGGGDLLTSARWVIGGLAAVTVVAVLGALGATSVPRNRSHSTTTE